MLIIAVGPPCFSSRKQEYDGVYYICLYSGKLLVIIRIITLGSVSIVLYGSRKSLSTLCTVSANDLEFALVLGRIPTSIRILEISHDIEISQ